jgi:hypothetical protein
MEIILNAIVVMGIEEGNVLFKMTTKVVVQELCEVKTCNGSVCEGKE